MMNAPSASPFSRALPRGRGTLALAGAFAFLLALSFAQIPPVWTSGAFGDTDDAMRMVQVRDLVAGQSWFDLTQRRMAPPEGAPMHWTRAVDAPLAAFLRLFALGLEPARAEAAARLLYSGLLLLLLLVACARFARTLMGARGRAPVLVSFALSGAVFGQFIWGRVDHHGLQLALLILLLDAALRALDPQRPRAAAVTACVGVISLCVSAENAPLVAAAFAIAPLRWAADGQGRSAIGYCACGLGVALPLAALVFIPAGAQAARACDAVSYAYLFAGVCGGVVLATLWAMAPRLRGASARALALVFAGALAVLCVALLFPDCLRHPYGAIDPLVRELWLGNVPEARSFAALWREDPIDALALAAPLAFAAGGIALAVMRAQGLARLRWIALAGVGLVACALVALEVRSFWQALFTLAWGASYAALREARRWRAPWLAFALVIAASPMFWALHATRRSPTARSQLCRPVACSRRSISAHIFLRIRIMRFWAAPIIACRAPTARSSIYFWRRRRMRCRSRAPPACVTLRPVSTRIRSPRSQTARLMGSRLRLRRGSRRTGCARFRSGTRLCAFTNCADARRMNKA